MRPSHAMRLALLFAAAACGDKQSAPPASGAPTVGAAPKVAALGPGESWLPVDGGRIWYKVSGTGNGAPVILLHGGPGFSSYYLKALEALGDERTVIRYDQLGGGRSDRISDTLMFTIPHFVRELDSLRSHLGFNKVHIVGHSWGTILGLEYYRAHPEHVLSLTLASAALDIPAWEKHARELIKTLSDSSQRAIAAAEKANKFDGPAYQNAINEFYGLYVWRHPVAADLDSTMSTVNDAIYGYMQGPSEFTISGTLKHYDALSYLKDVKVPTLFTVGEFDEANPVTIRRHAAMVKGAQVAVIPGSAHITTWDNPGEMIRAVRGFLKSADPRAAR